MTETSGKITKALASLKKGEMVVLYDGDEREGEADLIYHASVVTPAKIERLRKDAGGLICLAMSKQIAERLGLPFLSDILENDGRTKELVVKKTAYGDKPAFSVAINHKKVYTGIPDNDRALTIKEFSKLAEGGGNNAEFALNFYTPGHVFLLIGRGLENRKGHTELSLELAKRAKMSELMVLCEMLGKGKSLSKQEAQQYAKKNKLVFLEGSDIYG